MTPEERKQMARKAAASSWVRYQRTPDSEAMRRAIIRLVEASDGGADTYEVTDELEAAAKAAGLPDKSDRRAAWIRSLTS